MILIMITKFNFSSPKIKHFRLMGSYFSGEDTSTAFEKIGLLNTKARCNANNISIDGIYIIDEITYMDAEFKKAVELVKAFIFDKVRNEQYGDNTVMIFVVSDSRTTIYRDIHKAGFVTIVDGSFADLKIHVGVTPFVQFMYDIGDVKETVKH